MSLTILPFVFRLRRAVEPVIGHEVTSVHWIPLDDLLAAERRSVMDYVQQGATIQFPCLRIEDVVPGKNIRTLVSRCATPLGNWAVQPPPNQYRGARILKLRPGRCFER